MRERSELEKQAQAYLVQAREALNKAAECAEQGGFSISFRGGGTYVPEAAFRPNEELRREALESLSAEPYWAGLSDGEKNAAIDDLVDDWQSEMRPYDADGAGWWQPSRNC